MLNSIVSVIRQQYVSGVLPVKYLNNLVEQDRRFIKRLVKPGMGFFSDGGTPPLDGG